MAEGDARMISKAQERTLRGELTHEAHAHLSTLERGLIRWAMIEPGDRVLDANVGAGLVAEYLKRNAQCEVCGVSDSMEDVKLARGRLKSCDIVYASAGDIPWREGSFDTALMRADAMDEDDLRRRAGELKRVLKPGGQLIVGVGTALARTLAPGAREADDARRLGRRALEKALLALDFTKLTYQRAGLTCGVLIAWKRKPCVEDALQAAD